MTVAVIGLGSMGKRRIRLMKAMRLSINVIGVDSKYDRCEAAKKQFNIESYASLEEAEKHTKIRCVFICTSPLAHADIIHLCLLHGYHVFTEINLVSDRYSENILLAREKKLTLFLSSTPIYREEMKQITKVVKGNGNAVSYLYHVGQYLPDWHPWEKYDQFFVGDQRTNGCREIFAIELPWMVKAFGDIESVHVQTGRMTKLDISYQDTYMVQITHINGNLGVFAVDVTCRKPIRKLEVYNEGLYMEWEGTPQTLKKYDFHAREMKTVECGEYYNEPEYCEFVNECAYINEINEFFKVINGKQPEYTMEKDAEILKIIDKIEGIDKETKLS